MLFMTFEDVNKLWDDMSLFPILLFVISAYYLSQAIRNYRANVNPAGASRTTPTPISQTGSTVDYVKEVPFNIGETRVSRLFIHPIKSCRGLSLTEARFNAEGLENDRKWGVMDVKTHAIWTARQVANMVLISPRIEPDSSSPHGGSLIVSFPEDPGCETFSVPLNPTAEVLRDWEIVQDAEINQTFKVDGYICRSLTGAPDAPSVTLSKYFKRPVHLIMKGPVPRACPSTSAFPELQANSVYQDAYPLVVSEESLARVQSIVKDMVTRKAAIGGMDYERWGSASLDIERFRPNIVLKGSGVPFAEDFWRKIKITGSSQNTDGIEDATIVTLVSKCTRCLLPNVDVKTGVRDAAVPYKVLMKVRTGTNPANMSKACFGCNGIFNENGEGVIRVGDSITVIEWVGGIGV